MEDNLIEETNKLIKTVLKLKKNNQFKKYITDIYFPYYKNFKKFSKITFDFPLTVIVGKNGSGKSSIIQALYGCPEGKSTSDFWFSTATDPIDDGDGQNNRHCFVYSYIDDGEYKQVAYTRSSRPGTKTKKKNPDYWETSKPLRKYKMKMEKRFSPINENLVYLDFRQQLSAYDQYFYFGNTDNVKSNSKQDFIRYVSPKLDKALSDGRIYTAGTGRKKQNEFPTKLTDTELEYISYILGVTYTNGKILRHNFFEVWGDSALVTKNNISYTEAHAGSGEYAFINLVHKLSKLRDNTPALVLLDEPETSLYPGAQHRLLNFLLEVIKRKHCQIIISTHSEKFIECLPSSAIKAIHFNDKTGESTISDSSAPSSVFDELEIPQRSFNIFVEDRAACILINRVIEKEDIKSLQVKYVSAGADYLKQGMILADALNVEKEHFYLLDGDQKVNVVNLQEISNENLKDSRFIQNQVDKICSNITFPSSQSRNESKSSTKIDKIKYDSEIKYIEYFRNNVYFLPSVNPEAIVYREDYVISLLKMTSPNGKYEKIIRESSDKKSLYYKIAIQELGRKPSMEEYYALFERMVNYWIKNNSNTTYYEDIKNILREIQRKCERGE